MGKGGMWQPLVKISYCYWLLQAGPGWAEASDRKSEAEVVTAGI